MGKLEKIFEIVLRGSSDNNIRFEDVRNLLKSIGFNERIKGDHHIFYKNNVEEILNLQPAKGKSKSYQVKQVRNLILKYKLKLGS